MQEIAPTLEHSKAVSEMYKNKEREQRTQEKAKNPKVSKVNMKLILWGMGIN